MCEGTLLPYLEFHTWFLRLVWYRMSLLAGQGHRNKTVQSGAGGPSAIHGYHRFFMVWTRGFIVARNWERERRIMKVGRHFNQPLRSTT